MWNQVLAFVLENWLFLLFVLAFIGLLIFLAKKGYEGKVKRVLFYLVCQAEKEFGNGTGVLKYEAVVNWVYDLIPGWAQFLINQKTLDAWIEASVVQLKTMLEEKPEALNYFTDNTPMLE